MGRALCGGASFRSRGSPMVPTQLKMLSPVADERRCPRPPWSVGGRGRGRPGSKLQATAGREGRRARGKMAVDLVRSRGATRGKADVTSAGNFSARARDARGRARGTHHQAHELAL